MFDLSFDEWYLVISVAVLFGTAWHVYDVRRRELKQHRERCEREHVHTKKRVAKIAELTTEVLRTRYMVDAWLLRNPTLSLCHPDAKGVMAQHLTALRAFHEFAGRKHSRDWDPSVTQYDDPYWRAIWHIALANRHVRDLPPLPFE